MKITIITATYNSAATVRDTFNSILRQNYHDIEYIVVDGLSSDATVDIIKEYEPLFGGRMKWISEKDKGIYDAMNKGLRMATGEIVGILNSDDFYTSDDALKTIANIFEENDIDACYGDIHYVKDRDLNKCTRYYSSKIFRRGLMRLGFMPAHPSFYCKRAVYQKYGFFDTSFKIAADFENLLRLIYVNRIKTLYVNKDFVTMRAGGASNENLHSRWQIMKEHKKALKKNGIYSSTPLLSLRYVYKMRELYFRKRHHC